MDLNLSEMWMDLMNWALKPKKCGNTASNKEELGVFRDGRALHDNGVHPWAKPAPNIMDWQVFGFPPGNGSIHGISTNHQW